MGTGDKGSTGGREGRGWSGTCNVESKSLEVATTCSSQTLGLDSLTRTVSIDNVQDLIGKSEDTMNQIAAHAQTCATLRIKIKSLKDEAALAEQVNSDSSKLCECMVCEFRKMCENMGATPLALVTNWLMELVTSGVQCIIDFL